MTTTAPYGEWTSPLSARAVAAGSHVPDEARYVGEEVWWSEPIAAERRYALYRRTATGVEVVLPAPWNVRSGVHEYGGGAWTAIGTTVVFSHYGDHRLYRLDGSGAEPVPLTPEAGGFRFGGLVPGLQGTVLAVRETHTGDGPTDVDRDLVLIPLDGVAGSDAQAITSVVAGSRFLAQPRIAPDGGSMAWIAWEHPAMPWDSTELRVADIRDGSAQEVRTIAGGPGESVLQPEWLPDGTLAFSSDRTGWWNLYRVDPTGGEPTAVVAEDRETGGPLWVLGSRWYLPLPDGRILVTSTLGAEEQRLIGPEGTALLRGGRSRTNWEDRRGDRVLLTDTSAADPASLWELDTTTGDFALVRSGIDGLPLEVFPAAELVEIDGVHAVVYPPQNPSSRHRTASCRPTSRSCTAARPRRRASASTRASPTTRAGASAWSTSTTAVRRATGVRTGSGSTASGASSTCRTCSRSSLGWPSAAWPTGAGSPSRAGLRADGPSSRR